jgi:hypothetical protein
VLEVTRNVVWQVNQLVQESLDPRTQLVLVVRQTPCIHIPLQVIIQVFVRIPFGSITWQLKQFDLLRMLRYPRLYRSSLVRPQTINDQEYLLVRTTKQTALSESGISPFRQLTGDPKRDARAVLAEGKVPDRLE